MNAARVLKTPIFEGQVLKLQCEFWRVISVAKDGSKVVIKQVKTGKVKMVSGAEIE